MSRVVAVIVLFAATACGRIGYVALRSVDAARDAHEDGREAATDVAFIDAGDAPPDALGGVDATDGGTETGSDTALVADAADVDVSDALADALADAGGDAGADALPDSVGDVPTDGGTDAGADTAPDADVPPCPTYLPPLGTRGTATAYAAFPRGGRPGSVLVTPAGHLILAQNLVAGAYTIFGNAINVAADEFALLELDRTGVLVGRVDLPAGANERVVLVGDDVILSYGDHQLVRFRSNGLSLDWTVRAPMSGTLERATGVGLARGRDGTVSVAQAVSTAAMFNGFTTVSPSPQTFVVARYDEADGRFLDLTSWNASPVRPAPRATLSGARHPSGLDGVLIGLLTDDTSMDFGGGPRGSPDGRYLVRLDSLNAHRWSLAIDYAPDDSLVIAGGSIVVNGAEYDGSARPDGLVRAYDDATGAERWARTFSGTGFEDLRCVTAVGTDLVCVAGTSGNATLDGTAYPVATALLVGIDGGTGRVTWRTSLESEAPSFGPGSGVSVGLVATERCGTALMLLRQFYPITVGGVRYPTVGVDVLLVGVAL